MKFNLRQKIVLHLLVFLVLNGVICLLLYFSNSTINQKLQIIEKKKDLLDTVLEARRYEKNFFLRKNRNDLLESIAYIRKIQEKQDYITVEFADALKEGASVRLRAETILNYKKTMEDLNEAYTILENGSGNPGLEQRIALLQESATQLGRRLTTDIEEVQSHERKKVFDLLDTSRVYLLVSLFSLFLLTFLTAFFLAMNVNRPLKSIEESVQRIVRGDFNKIPKIVTGDEFESLANSLNDLIEELDRRKDQLVQAEKMSSLGTLTSGVAHELNNPLNNISTSIQIIREELDDPDLDFKRNLLIEAEQQIDRARDVIKALLEFSRQSEFSVEPVVFENLVRSTMHLIAGEIPSTIDIVMDLPDGLEGRMDPRRIQQVLLNLIINSVHAMPDGGRLTLSARQDREKSLFIFSVTDTGQGIPREALARIFDPFFTTKPVGKGSGLGLSIIHGIIRQHDGTIDVDSTEGQGTTFTISLPV